MRIYLRQSCQLLVAMVAAACFFGAQIAVAAQPVRFNYQAILTDASGAPLQGTHTLFISLWDGGTSATADSGTLVYGESFNATLDNATLNHAVGTGTAFSGSLSESLFSSSNDIFVQLSVDMLGNVVLPRARLESVPFAIRALSAGGATGSLPSGLLTLSDTPTAPPGFTATGTKMFQSWLSRRDLGVGRRMLGVAAANGKVFSIGGRISSGVPSNITAIYDPETNTTYDDGAPMPTARRLLACAELNGLIYAIGGFDSSNAVVGIVEVYDPLNGPLGTWTPRQSLIMPRLLHAAAAANNHIYVFGGDNTETTNSVEAYDTVFNNWTVKAPMPTARYGCSAATLNGKIYVTGGFSMSGLPTAANEEYDPVANTWATRAPLPATRGSGAMVSAAGRLYYMGGYEGSLSAYMAKSEIWIYSPDSDKWTVGPSLPTVRADFAAAVVDETIFAVGGSDDTGDYGKRIDALNAGTYYLMRKD